MIAYYSETILWMFTAAACPAFDIRELISNLNAAQTYLKQRDPMCRLFVRHASWILKCCNFPGMTKVMSSCRGLLNESHQLDCGESIVVTQSALGQYMRPCTLSHSFSPRTRSPVHAQIAGPGRPAVPCTRIRGLLQPRMVRVPVSSRLYQCFPTAQLYHILLVGDPIMRRLIMG